MAGCGEPFLPENGGDWMGPMTVAGSPAEAQYNHVWPESPDRPHDVAKDLVVPTPLFKRFLGRFAEPEIDRPREKLLGAVDSPGRQKFLSANHSQRVALFRANQILPALAAGEREIARPHLAATREIGQNRCVFIVRMGGDHQDTAGNVQTIQRQLSLCGTR